MAQQLSVVVSQGQSHNPVKRQLEEDIVAGLLFQQGVQVTVVPHLYDLSADSTGMLALQGISGDLAMLSWIYERAARWVLHRNGVSGQAGNSLLARDEDAEGDDLEDGDAAGEKIPEGPTEDDPLRVVNGLELPPRRIFCIDLRVRESADDYLAEIQRICEELATPVVSLGDWVQGTPRPDQLARYQTPANDTALGAAGKLQQESAAGNGSGPSAALQRVDEEPARRWYPVIDFSRCTNCMECIDFCLFGVYGVDQQETILVEQPDNCRKGCPACSRVCPENAIIFPQHKTPIIAGAPGDAVGGLKIDLSKLFGAPDGTATAEQIAARERDEQLVMAGRTALGTPTAENRPTGAETKDDLDDLLDQLDDMDL